MTAGFCLLFIDLPVLEIISADAGAIGHCERPTQFLLPNPWALKRGPVGINDCLAIYAVVSSISASERVAIAVGIVGRDDFCVCAS